jgi:hypothetical protein
MDALFNIYLLVFLLLFHMIGHIFGVKFKGLELMTEFFNLTIQLKIDHI